MKIKLADTDMAITFAIAVIEDSFNIKINKSEFSFAGYTNNDDGTCTYSLLVKKYPLLIHIIIDKKKFQFKSQIEVPKMEYLFDLIKQ